MEGFDRLIESLRETERMAMEEWGAPAAPSLLAVLVLIHRFPIWRI